MRDGTGRWYGIVLVVTQLLRQSSLNELVWEYQCQGSLRNLHCSITHCYHIPAGGTHSPNKIFTGVKYVFKLLVQWCHVLH